MIDHDDEEARELLHIVQGATLVIVGAIVCMVILGAFVAVAVW